MEAGKIDWNSLESVYVFDNLFENMNAPQWIDFLAPDLHSDAEAEADAWFCRPECNHPKTADDLFISTPPPSNSKLLRSVSVTKLIGLADWTRIRETNLKRRGLGRSENDNPPNLLQINSTTTTTTKSSADTEIKSDEQQRRLLKDTQCRSASDLFPGRDIFTKITHLCNELKKMATLSRPKDNETMDQQQQVQPPPPPPHNNNNNKLMTQQPKERKPFSELHKPSPPPPHQGSPNHNHNHNQKQKLRKKIIKNDDEPQTENISIPISLNLKNMNKHNEEDRLLPIRTNPPTPQGFSATRDPTKSTPSKAPPKSRLMKREILQEVEQDGRLGEELCENSHTANASLIAGKQQGRALDVLWFLKPCTL